MSSHTDLMGHDDAIVNSLHCICFACYWHIRLWRHKLRWKTVRNPEQARLWACQQYCRILRRHDRNAAVTHWLQYSHKQQIMATTASRLFDWHLHSSDSLLCNKVIKDSTFCPPCTMHRSSTQQPNSIVYGEAYSQGMSAAGKTGRGGAEALKIRPSLHSPAVWHPLVVSLTIHHICPIMTSFTKPKESNVLHCRQKTELRPWASKFREVWTRHEILPLVLSHCWLGMGKHLACKNWVINC